MNPAATPENPSQTVPPQALSGPSKPAFIEPRLAFVEPQLIPCGDLREVTAGGTGDFSLP
jgi:hypothetical protein